MSTDEATYQNRVRQGGAQADEVAAGAKKPSVPRHGQETSRSGR